MICRLLQSYTDVYDRACIVTPIPGSIRITVISHGMPPPYRAVSIAVPADRRRRRQRPVVVDRQGRPDIDSCVGGTDIHMG